MDGNPIKAPQTLRVAPVGSCIYCGTSEGRLTEEHIIPKGLGGTLVLPQASCDACARVTSQFEMRVLRGFMDRGRQAMGIKGRKTHKRAAAGKLTQTLIQADESLVKLEVPWDEGLKIMHLPVFLPPRFLDPQRPPDPGTEKLEVMALDTIHFGLENGKLVRESQAQGVRFDDRMDVWAFVRLLAKIAHGYHVAVNGAFPLRESPLLPIILGQRLDAINWIGNTTHPNLPSGGAALHPLHHLPVESDDGTRGTAVLVKLFSTHPTATYTLATRFEAPPGA